MEKGDLDLSWANPYIGSAKCNFKALNSRIFELLSSLSNLILSKLDSFLMYFILISSPKVSDGFEVEVKKVSDAISRVTFTLRQTEDAKVPFLLVKSI